MGYGRRRDHDHARKLKPEAFSVKRLPKSYDLTRTVRLDLQWSLFVPVMALNVKMGPMNLIAQSVERAELVTSAPNLTIKFRFRILCKCDYRGVGIYWHK